MSTPITTNRVRLKLDMLVHTEAVCVIRNAAPKVWRGADLQIELGLFFGGTIIDAFTNIATLYLDIVPYNDRDGAPLVSKSLPVADLDVVTEVNWNLGTAANCNALFTLTKTEMQLTMADASENLAKFLIVVHAVSTDATPKYLTYGIAQLIVEEDGAQNGLSVVGPLSGSWRLKQVGAEQFLQIYNPDQAKWHTIMVRGAAGAETLALGAAES